ncbi:hypothetical protein BC834DRAFT_824367 [Gloeopeniophorella convolvens]|nr:hypothetical protein BC834DRAFT_824367 [Gloeopeniophorella convolvens]
MFLPRSVAKAAKQGSGSNTQSTTVASTRESTGVVVQTEPHDVEANVKRPSTSDTVSEDPAALCALAFSDYELWENPTLRDPNRDGFVSLSTLLNNAPVFAASTSLTETAVIKSLRTHAKDDFDVRMIVVDKARSGRYAPPGGYEVRRRDWADVTERFSTFSPEYWEARTVYIENIPFSHRSPAGISKLVHTLLTEPSHQSSNDPSSYRRRIQRIHFPPHHQDPPDALPKCKGFALLTLSTPTDVSLLLSRFPWKPITAAPGDETSPEEAEARKSGFRTLSKARWDALHAEYEAYRAELLQRSASAPAPSTAAAASAPARTMAPPKPVHVAHAYAEREERPARPPPYPPSCVLFARRVPPDTNKTALRTRFSAHLDDAAALDYVDYSKGLDSCYLRLTAPRHARELLARFGEAEQGEGAIALELLEGRREEVYWAQVPEKVRMLAVQRAQAQEAGNGGEPAQADTEGGGDGRKRRRHRR